MSRPTITPCPDAAQLQRLLLGLVAGPEAEQLEEHVAACPRCAAIAPTLEPEDDLVRAMQGADLDDTSPQQPLIDAVLPLLKRLRRVSETETLPPRAEAGGRSVSGDTTAGAHGALTPVDQPGALTSLGSYRVVRELGHGGMGVVYVAEDPQLRRLIALKVIRPELLARDDVRQRFLSEAQAVAAVPHDHIVPIFHVGEHDGLPYLAMPLLRGQTLEERLRQAGGPLPVDELLRIGRQTAEGLAAAHAQGLVHRDIKPNNLFLETKDEGGRMKDEDSSFILPPSSFHVKILDFGLARLVQDETGVPVEGAVTGTPAYMAPEQARGEAVDARCDLFSLGCVLYRMATGRPPFSGGELIAVLMSVALDEPPPPRTLNPDVPPALAELIERLLAKKPALRPTSAQEVAEALRAIEQQRADARRPRPRRWPWLAACVVAVLAAAGLTAWLLPPEPAADAPPEPGEVTFAFDAPDGQLLVQHADDPEQAIDLTKARTLSLPPGEYAVRVATPRPGRTLMPDQFLVKPGAAVVVPLRLVGEVGRHRLHSLSVSAVALAPVPGSLLALSAGADRAVIGWDAGADGDPWVLGEHGDPVRCVAIAPDGARAASGGGGRVPARRKSDNAIRLWDLKDRHELAKLSGHPGWVTSVAFAPDGLQLVSGDRDGNVWLWDLRTNTPLRRLTGHPQAPVRSVGFSPDGKQVLSAGEDERVCVWDAADGQLRGKLDGYRVARFAPDGKRIAVAGTGKGICLWEPATGACRELQAACSDAVCLAWSPDGRRLLFAGAERGKDCALHLWDVTTAEELVLLHGHTGTVNSVAFSADGRYALSGSADQYVRFWELPK